MQNNQDHWNHIYTTRAEDEVSWFQPYPKTSMAFVELFHLSPDANIVDIGGGDSHFVDALLDKGYKNIWVLDISAAAIERAKNRLGEKATMVHWIVCDVTEFQPPVQFDLWHDRAAFHFLTSEEKIYRYASIAEDAIKKNGYLVLGTFSENGPKKCSGLDIKQYSEAAMSARFELSFERIKCVSEDHETPFHTMQNFLFCSFRRY
ncbi:MAG TPA: class I SAM-dependent methyltransferase [Flavisolibacter sp.]|jgi:SAM-dependent methyltransferase|nr:class I SAM-dependent methyltransferase [Flavisolibacter sp.]